MSVLNFIVLSYNTVSLGLSPSGLLYIHCQPLSLFLLSLPPTLSGHTVQFSALSCGNVRVRHSSVILNATVVKANFCVNSVQYNIHDRCDNIFALV